ncbi:hypothetical protein NXV05_08255 [Parabacteroides johnsonii]|nr:hypothetical protein [Parabacteroides johnsonii]
MKSLLNISCLRISLCLLLCLAGTSFVHTLHAQIPDRVFKTDYRIDPGKKGELSVEIDNLSFFKDDEYTGSFMKGYTLPGLWLQAKAVYYPLEMLKLEAGVHLQRFWGRIAIPIWLIRILRIGKVISTRKASTHFPGSGRRWPCPIM